LAFQRSSFDRPSFEAADRRIVTADQPHGAAVHRFDTTLAPMQTHRLTGSQVFHFLCPALMMMLAAGGASGGLSVQEGEGLLSGLAEGFLILFRFLGGYLADPTYLTGLRTANSYQVGYITGALTFSALGTILSLPWRDGGAP
jgi:hypothetical protein